MRKLTLTFALFSRFASFCFAQTPVVKVDLNFSGRQEAEVNEPGYTAWPIATASTATMVIENVTFTFTGTSFTSEWYKAGIQSPNYARLACDGLVASAVELRISGLPAGKHTLLTYHNSNVSPTTGTFSPMDVYVDGVQVVNDLMPSNRELVISNVPVSYLTLDAKANTDIVIKFESEPTSTATIKNVYICGFELNTPHNSLQARLPIPSDMDKHVDADLGTLALKWTHAPGAVSHDVYFGTNAADIAAANHSSALFKGNQTDTTYSAGNLNAMTTCYWRIDEISSIGIVTRGNTWMFIPRRIAFKGAEGYGRFAIGGRGGKVVEVTTLADDGAGSFREAVTNDIGPRTIVFKVSGMITLSSRLTLTQNNITIAGQTAPGKGICIRKAPFGLSGAQDIVIQNVRVRLGSGITYDGMGMSGSDYCIIDHSSISWTIDEAFSSRSGKNITLQRTLISEALNVAGHQNYPAGTAHGYAASISGDIGSFHHNLLAHCDGRNWSLAGGLDGNGNYSGRLDIFNNVVYNWYDRATDGGAHEVNFVNNYYKKGASTKTNYALNAQYDAFPGTQQYYFAGNVMPGVFDETTQANGRKYTGTPNGYSPWVDQSFFPSYATVQTASDAFKNVLSDVGCTQPVFDDHDIRVVNETLNGTYSCVGSVSGLPGLPDNETDIGGWENYPEIQRPNSWDTDHDGIPDWWEALKGLNAYSAVGDFSDSNADADHDGYTNLEEYLMWMGNPHFFTTNNTAVTIDLSTLNRGYTVSPSFLFTNVVNGIITQSPGSPTIQFKPKASGLASFTFTITDGAGSTMSQQIGIFNENLTKAPANQTIIRTIDSIASTTAVIRLMKGSGDNRIVFISSNNSGTNPSLADETEYTQGATVNSGNWICAYNTSDSIARLKNLSPNTAYTVVAYEYNGTSTISKYLQTISHNVSQFATTADKTNVEAGTTFNTKIFPNPVFNNLYISSDSEIKNIQIVDLQNVEYVNVSGTFKSKDLSLSDLPSGIYLIKLRFDSNVLVRKIVKE
jgi:hypothetical protein